MPEIFVPPERIKAEPDWKVVDVRRGWDDETEYIPNAVRIPFEQFRDPGDEMEGKLPTPAAFASLLSEAGIESDDRLVAYDDDHGVYASRFLVTAALFGHDLERLYLMDGDITAWARNYETAETVPERKETDYTCEIRTDNSLVSAVDLEDALDSDAVIVDTRDQIEYDTVHLPGAINFQWHTLVDDEARHLKPRDELESILKSHEITPDRPVRLYCNTARRLSFVYATLLELGYEDVGFYEGGIKAWTEYGGSVETTL
ncbi:sulfurtransferase [Haloferax sp. Atlit-6N]|uniref:Rhodanese domain protein n=1 Tax=Haloferax gibbonsii TaxID=35746 RepID=A0A871BL10_HALGI|nr:MULTISPECIES: rhodanese-like domain-containing protein [Haloferax]QOS13434.1 rhodanese domain protein [Haloferax gibbonsii]REA00532.1 sulfurtransferase [Haloferax sp. Atlit-6N]